MEENVTGNDIPIEEIPSEVLPNEEIPEENIQTENDTTEVIPDNKGNILEDTESTTNDTSDILDTVETTEDGILSETETVSGSNVRTDTPTEEYASISGNDVYIIETTTEEQPFLTKPFSEYTTSEGLLLLIFILLLLSCLWSLINGK